MKKILLFLFSLLAAQPAPAAEPGQQLALNFSFGAAIYPSASKAEAILVFNPDTGPPAISEDFSVIRGRDSTTRIAIFPAFRWDLASIIRLADTTYQVRNRWREEAGSRSCCFGETVRVSLGHLPLNVFFALAPPSSVYVGDAEDEISSGLLMSVRFEL